MLLPGLENAEIDILKLSEYCLSDSHPVGKHKAVLFKKLLGFTKENAEHLKKIIIDNISLNDAIFQSEDEYGKRYAVKFKLVNKNNIITIITIWIILKGTDNPKLVTCYIKS